MTLNRAKIGNCLDSETYHLLIAGFKEAAKNSDVKCVLLSGTGKFFSTGADVQLVLDGVDDPTKGPAHVIEVIRRSAVTLTQDLIDFPKPLVAAVNGPAVGWSAAALGLFDIIYMAESATIQTPFMTLGLVPEGVSSVTFPQRMGRSLASEVLLLGRKATAAELLGAGFTSHVFPDEAFDIKVSEVLEKAVAQASSASFFGGKRLLFDAKTREMLTEANKAEFLGLKQQFEDGEPIRRFKALQAQLAAKKKA